VIAALENQSTAMIAVAAPISVLAAGRLILPVLKDD